MKIAYDGSGLTPPLTGVGNYIQQLLTHLLRIDRDNRYWLLAHRRPYLEPWLNGEGGVQRVPAHFPNRLFWMQCILPFTLRALQPDVAHFPNFVAPLVNLDNLVVTVHDLSLLRFPEMHSPRQRVLMRPLVQPTARRARAIITVSEQSKREIVQRLGVAAQNVHVIYEAAAPIFHESMDAEQCKRRLAPYGWDAAGARNLVYVGTIEPRKNLERLVCALSMLHRRGERAHLWIVGQGGWQSAPLWRRRHELGLKNFVHLTGYVPVADLCAFYRRCDLFVFPSLHEGFGLPVVEAMACGAPVILSNTPASREISGDAGLYFDPTNAEAIAELLRSVLGDEALRMELRTRARARAAQFSWKRAAQETLRVYQQVAKRSTSESEG